METLEQLNSIFREVLEEENLNISREDTANDIDNWDSLNHIQLVVAIEKQFNIRFTSQEIQSWENVGDIVDCINSK